MNGDLTELYNKLHTDLKVLERIMEERWKNHATRGEEIGKNIANIYTKLNGLDCKGHKERIKGLDIRVGWLYVLLGSILLYTMLKPLIVTAFTTIR